MNVAVKGFDVGDEDQGIGEPLRQPGRAARADFPLFATPPNEHLSYLDSAATTQKPKVVLDRMYEFYTTDYANVHRGAYRLSAAATDAYDAARRRVARFIGAESARGVIFVRGTTDGINTIAHSIGARLSEGDTILVTYLEHHSNLVPWQMVAKARGAKIVAVEITAAGQLDLADLSAKLEQYNPKVLAVTQLSNALGTVTPLKEAIDAAHAAGALVLVDGAQGVAHLRTNVAELDCDFYAFSAHKVYGPTGIGVVYGKPELLDSLEPAAGGGGMITSVSISGSTWAELPAKFEAGTPPIAEAVGLEAALDYVESFDRTAVRDHEAKLLAAAWQKLGAVPKVRLLGVHGSGGPQVSILSFMVEGVHPHDLATIADEGGVQIRAGHHCNMPLLVRMNLGPTARASFGLYNTEEDVDRLVEVVLRAKAIFKV